MLSLSKHGLSGIAPFDKPLDKLGTTLRVAVRSQQSFITLVRT